MKDNHVIGIMGPGKGATRQDTETAFELGKLLAENHFLVLTGGRASGVMDAAMHGAKSAGGTTIGILPSAGGECQSKYADIVIKTGMGSARNNINVLSSDVVVVVGIGPGTTSEISLAIKADKPLILLGQTKESEAFFRSFNYQKLLFCSSSNEALTRIKSLLK